MDWQTEIATARRFDAHALDFDGRAGVLPGAAAEVAIAVLGSGRPTTGGEVVLEIGAGTGEVGQHLARLAESYIGLDLSAPMLAIFRSKLTVSASGRTRSLLARADGDRPWPLRSSSVNVVFASRVAHLLVRDHIVGETRRVCRPGGRFLIGRVDRTGVKQTLRHQREAMLADRRVTAQRSGGRRTQDILNALVTEGGVAEPTRTVATWQTSVTPEQVIAAWETMPTMAGVALEPSTKAEVLSQLRAWARGRFGALDRPQSGIERYTLEGVRIG